MGAEIIIPTGKMMGKRPWTPAEITSGKPVWLDAADTSTISDTGGLVDLWTNKGGSSYDPVGTTTTRPTTNSRTVNGKNVIDFTASHRMKDSTDGWGHGSDWTLAFFGDIDSGTTILSEASSGGAQAWNFMTSSFSTQRDGSVSYTTLSGPTLCIMKSDLTGGEMEVWIDGIIEGTQTIDEKMGNSTGRINENFVGGSRADYGCGEIVMVNDITTETRQKLEGYLAWKWGQQASLPGGHPYENERPIV